MLILLFDLFTNVYKDNNFYPARTSYNDIFSFWKNDEKYNVFT